MRRVATCLCGAAIALGSATLALAAPEDLLPDSFGAPPPPPVQPARTATPTPTSTPVPMPAPGATAGAPAGDAGTGAPQPGGTSLPVVQPLPGEGDSAYAPGLIELPDDFPTLEELEAMETDEINQILGLRPKFDIPPAARRAMERVGVISMAEGGFASRSLAGQPARLVRAALQASDGPLVSRWGHILMRRVLASRLDAPQGMDPAEFAALRASALNAMGESAVARSLVQDVDGNNYDRRMVDAAFNAYLATGDLLGMCPVARLQATIREDGEWELLQAICSAYLGEARSAERRLDRALGLGQAAEIDVRLAQRYAGAAGEGRRAVNIEWSGVDELTPWRYSLARSLGVEIPDGLPAARYAIPEVLIPATPLLPRMLASDRAAERGVLSSAALVDLYSQLWASDQYSAADKTLARQLREAYVASEVSARIEAMRQLWSSGDPYARQVLTAYAAARLPVDEALVEDAPRLIASMLAAGLDRNALRWGSVVPEGSEGWALLVLAQPQRQNGVDSGALDRFIDNDGSPQQRKSRFLLAGLAALGRISEADAQDAADQLGMELSRSSAWSDKISRAAEYRNPALVALLAGLGMQGSDWDQMTGRQLFHIVRALDRAGLGAEARMIAAEAVARG